MDPGLAKGWKHEPLSELITFATGGVWGDAPDTANGVNSLEAACIRGTDFRDWEVRKASAAVSRAIDAKSLEKRKLQSGDILVEVSGGGPEQPVGRTVHIDEEAIESAQGRPMVPTNFLRLLRLRSGVDAAYVNYYLKYFYVTGNISDYQGGSNNLRNLRFKDYITIDIPLAPLPEQRRIVEAIELQLGRLDAAVAHLHAAKAKLKRYKQAVLKAAVEGMLTDPDLSEGELPDDWTWTTLGEVVELVSGGTPKGLNESATGGSIPFFKVGDMTLEGNDHYMESSRTYLTEAEAKRLKLTVHPAGTVIFPKRGGAILTNKKRVLSNPGAFDLNLMGALPNDEVDGDFLFYWFEQLDLSKIYDGSNIPQINKKNVDPLPFAKPTLKEQRRIAAELDRLLSSSNETEATLEAQLAQAARLRQSVLKRAFEGRLV